MTPFLSIVGIGEDGVGALAPAASDAIAAAHSVYGGRRHLELAAPLIRSAAIPWSSPIAAILDEIATADRTSPIAVLASGDPFCFGIGSLLAARLPREIWRAWPRPSSIALATAELGWPAETTAIVSLCGRPIAPLVAAIAPEARVIALSADATTPSRIASFLAEHGAQTATLHVMERLGGPHARIRSFRAADPLPTDIHPLNLVAIEFPPELGPSRLPPLTPGLPSASFEHDGQITRPELRATALAALAPRPHELLWDIGAGAGSIAIEWARLHPTLRAVAFERDPDRLARLARNAARHHVADRIEPVRGEAPAILATRTDSPDAIFIGGGGRIDTIEAAWKELRPGGRLVAHAVTLETEQALVEAQSRHGGTLTRFGIETLGRIGDYRAFRPAMTVTQWSATRT